jgi:hypothetical protein
MEERLREGTGDPEAGLITGCHIGGGTAEDYISITVRCRTKKKDGTLSRLKTDHHIMGAYCPFCGKKLKEK